MVCEQVCMEKILKPKLWDRVTFVELKGPTRGAAETVLRGLEGLPAELVARPVMLCDGDTFYTADIVRCAHVFAPHMRVLDHHLRAPIASVSQTQIALVYFSLTLFSLGLIPPISTKCHMSRLSPTPVQQIPCGSGERPKWGVLLPGRPRQADLLVHSSP